MSRIYVLAVLLAPAIAGTALAQPPARTPETVSYSIGGAYSIEVFQMPVSMQLLLLRIDAVQQELRLTEAQKKRQTAIVERRLETMRKARQEYDNQEIFDAARNAMVADEVAALQETLEPGQRDRLDQIQIQAQGPLAFERREIQRRLGLTADQVDEIESIVDKGKDEIRKAASFPLEVNQKETQTEETVRKLVDGLEFQLMKEKTRHIVLASRLATMVRIVKVLTEPQRAAYRKMFGEPFDTGKLKPKIDERESDVRLVAALLRLTGQRADVLFDVRVTRPAYITAHPRVLIDEAHRNFHTVSGRYRPFANLISNDGYIVSPNKEKFTRNVLEACDILVIANAMGAESMRSPGAEKPAFTEDECQAVHDWVKAGGSLLLITDHEPFGAAAGELGKRFGVEMGKTVARDQANMEPESRGLLFSRDKKLLRDHPIIRGRNESERINRVKTFTGQSLKGPPGSVSFLTFSATATAGSSKNQVPITGRSQGLAMTYGQGRIVVLGEAAQLSAQLTGLGREPRNMMGMNAPGIDNKQMALNIMHWLSGVLEPRDASLKRAG
jgi:hypothetical protein